MEIIKGMKKKFIGIKTTQKNETPQRLRRKLREIKEIVAADTKKRKRNKQN